MAKRTRDSAATKAAILAAARLQFGQNGFERTTIRSVAAAAGVDPALVMHYFVSKDELFGAVSRLDISPPDLTGVAPEDVAGVLLPVFARVWGPDGPFLPLLRAAASSPQAAEALLDVFVRQVAPALAVAAVDRPEQRAALIGSHLLGIAVARHIIAIPAIVTMEDAALAAWLRPVLTHYLTDPAPEDRAV
ncbi:TetR family transcriptional regulator [Aeromicrobium chenweiae]|uniref:TetR family transcriptional regulator n=1 Tax=Aeromicrobium chenweiae TaxID=2079793 RepID=A0A2S0WJD8_9ACTN|nr:TetR family transcriptional regulator [Aeromicrobium chenweiae]AWB91407.1 TetR family transcriptional regulator [Aeromicrobium chenweiae]TGN30662.1 TetR/AcrR family transcriptional regulator [Aeromicrobium chenweiae]